jgi:hypothetical protein
VLVPAVVESTGEVRRGASAHAAAYSAGIEQNHVAADERKLVSDAQPGNAAADHHDFRFDMLLQRRWPQISANLRTTGDCTADKVPYPATPFEAPRSDKVHRAEPESSNGREVAQRGGAGLWIIQL